MGWGEGYGYVDLAIPSNQILTTAGTGKLAHLPAMGLCLERDSPAKLARTTLGTGIEVRRARVIVGGGRYEVHVGLVPWAAWRIHSAG